ncbi:MAG: 3',5'-cyclic-AMP phosphodiesterase [Leptolyngbyaceae cyanobacterium SL_7_1]|nr:3',5'-cyclic-AMP phosphodiesterase [Leptolyngbyaceae cyanobacterium SL_7_1]
MAPTSITVAQLTDTHLFADAAEQMRGCVTWESLQSVLALLKNLTPRPDLLVLTGDLSQDETVASYQRLREAIAPLAIPTYRIPGNHDIVPRLQEVLRGEPFIPAAQFNQGGWLGLLLDSTVPGSTAGAVSPETLAWVEAQLTQHPQQPTLIALHHPPVAIGSDWMDGLGLENGDAFSQVLDRHSQVKLVIFGHIHQAFDETRNGVRYLGCPSTCVQFTPQSTTFAIDPVTPGLRVLTLHPDGQFTTAIQRVRAESLGSFAATASQR